MAPLTDRMTFRALVADVAAKAKAKLPECNGRVEKAVALVLAGDVFFQDNGQVLVGSASDALSTHRVAGTSCSCEDSQYHRAPYCKHVLAVMIQTRVGQLMSSQPEPEEV